MKPRLLILLAVFVAVAGYAFMRPKASHSELAGSPQRPDRLTDRNEKLPNEEPPVAPMFKVQVEVPEGSTSQILLHLSEEHGFYAETFRIQVWKKGHPDRVVEFYINDCLKAQGTLTVQEHVVPAELSNLGGELGTSDVWEARVVYYGRARERNPDPLPEAPHDP